MTTSSSAIARRITPPNLLQAKVPPFGGPSLAEMRVDVAMALDTLRADARDWLGESAGRLAALLGEAAAGEPTAAVARMSRVGNDLRTIALQFDYPLLAQAAHSLCDFIVADPALAAARLDVLRVHVDAISAILTDDLRGVGTAEAVRVVGGLGMAVEKARAMAAVAGEDRPAGDG